MKNNNWIYNLLELRNPRFCKGRRGEYVSFDTVDIHNIHVSDINENEKVKIEFDYLLRGKFNELRKWKIWENDEDLLMDYIRLFKLFKKVLKENYNYLETSRNVVFSNRRCCFCYFQKVENKLYVTSRSSDLKALSWDLEMCKYFAQMLNCNLINIRLMLPHFYLSEGINRRKKEEVKEND